MSDPGKAWQDKKVFPDVIVMAVRKAVKNSKGKPNAHAITSGFQLLQDDEVNGNEELDILRKKAYTVVSALKIQANGLLSCL